MARKKQILHLIQTTNHWIFDQLLLEEKLLHETNKNWCVINEGTSPAIILGISNNPQKMVHLPEAKRLMIPIIRRFTGGGTIIANEDTFFVTFIFSKKTLPFSFPEAVFRWIEDFYKKALAIPLFSFRENDFLIGNNKCAGNALYFKKNRWLCHTSFLWKYQKEQLHLLKLPEKMPFYRQNRSHEDFLSCLHSHFHSKRSFVKKIQDTLSYRFDLQEIPLIKIRTKKDKDRKLITTYL